MTTTSDFAHGASLVPLNGELAGRRFDVRGAQPGVFSLGLENCGNPDLGCRGIELRVSRKHCGIFWVHDRFQLQDLGSSNGTFLNGEPINNTCVFLAHGDVITAGKWQLRFELDARLRSLQAE